MPECLEGVREGGLFLDVSHGVMVSAKSLP